MVLVNCECGNVFEIPRFYDKKTEMYVGKAQAPCLKCGRMVTSD